MSARAAGRLDAELYAHFRNEFPDLQVGKIDEEKLKAKDQQAKWREFCEKYRDTIKDYNFGTLLRLDSKGDYTPENTTFGTPLPEDGEAVGRPPLRRPAAAVRLLGSGASRARAVLRHRGGPQQGGPQRGPPVACVAIYTQCC